MFRNAYTSLAKQIALVPKAHSECKWEKQNACNSSAFGIWFDPNSAIALKRISQVSRGKPSNIHSSLGIWTWKTHRVLCFSSYFLYSLSLSLVPPLSFTCRIVYLRSACYNFHTHTSLVITKPSRLMQKLNSILLFLFESRYFHFVLRSNTQRHEHAKK